MIKVPNSLLTKIAVGVGVSVAAPLVYRVLQNGEPLTARNIMKEGIRTYNQLRISLAETKENLSDLAAEAQAELQEAGEQTYDTLAESETEAASEPKAKAKPKAAKAKAAKGKA